MNGSGKVLRNECEELTVQSYKEQKTFSCGILDWRKQHPHTHKNAHTQKPHSPSPDGCKILPDSALHLEFKEEAWILLKYSNQTEKFILAALEIQHNHQRASRAEIYLYLLWMFLNQQIDNFRNFERGILK